MTFTDKLRKLTEGGSRAGISRRAGLSPTAVNDYLQRGYIPKIDNGLALARALNVPLEWLADDAQEWPPPKDSATSAVSNFSTGALTLELARRWRLEQLDAEDAFKRIEPIDWSKLKSALKAGDPERLTKSVHQQLQLMADALGKFERVEMRESLALLGDLLHDELAGSDGPLPTELKVNQWKRFTELLGDENFTYVYFWLIDHHAKLGILPASLIGMNKVLELLDATSRAAALRAAKSLRKPS